MEIDEWIVSGGILVAWRGDVRALATACWRMAAGGGLARRVVAHVLHVTFPAQLCRLELIRQALHDRGIQATSAQRLAVAIQTRLAEPKFAHRGAVALRLRIRCLATHEGEVVVETGMSDPVVVG